MLLTSFQTVRPRHEAAQGEILAWLADVHTRAARTAAASASFDAEAFHQRMRRLIRHVGCGPDKIASRGYSASDHDHCAEGEPALYDVDRSPFGEGTAARTDWFSHEVESVFERLYETERRPPHDLVHVTCTGYASPSGAQRLVSRRGWGGRTRVTHLYHMGCYASVPALRVVRGLLAADNAAGARVDVVHTELCSLHFDPSVHTPEQIVVQSLFADGSVRYAASERADAPALRVLALEEVLDDGSDDAMQWSVGDHGTRMSLSREVPERIARAIRPFVGRLLEGAGLDVAEELSRAVFAVHPGGPKIVDVVSDALELRDAQVAASRAVLQRYGNMSSATLPYVWRDVLDDCEIPPGAVVVSLAFGPGLTLCGAVFRKE